MMKAFVVILNIITIVMVVIVLRITFVAYSDRDRKDYPTPLDVIKTLYKDNNAISPSRARIIPKYGDIGEFTDYDHNPDEYHIFDKYSKYDRLGMSDELELLINSDPSAKRAKKIREELERIYEL